MEKVQLWRRRITQAKSMFPRTAACNVDAHITSLIHDSLVLLENQINKYFPNVDIEAYDWVRDPFHVSVADLQNLKLTEEEDLCSLKNDRTLLLQWKKLTLPKFWILTSQEYPAISERVLSILLPFSTTYLCEQGFSALTNIKSKTRERLTDTSVENEMRVCLSQICPRIKKICSESQAHISH